MATSQDKVELLVSILGQEGIDRLAKSTEHLKSQLEEMARAFKAGEIGAAEFYKAQSKLARELEQQQVLFDQLTGKPGGGGGAGGQGILGASYAMQDFISVLTGGGGLGRALGSITNNIPALLTGLGAGAGLTGIISGLFTLMVAGVPAIEKWWGAIDSESADKARTKLEGIKAQIEAVHAEFKKLAEAPTDYEKTAAEGVGLFLKERPNADRARAAVASGLTNAEAGTKIDAGAYRGLEGAATATDESLLNEGRIHARRMYGSDVTPELIEQEAKRYAAQGAERRATAQRQRAEMMRGARQARAEEIVTQATVAGPAGEAARRRLMELTRGKPGFGELQGMTPDRIRADDEADDADEGPGSDAFAERARKGVAARKKARAAEAKREQRRAELQHAQTDAALKGNAQKIRAGRSADAALANADDGGSAPTRVELQQAQAIQQGMRAQGGRGAPTQDIVAAIRRSSADADRARQQGLDSIIGAFTGASNEVAQWRQAQSQMRAMQGRMQRGIEQTPSPSGLQR